MKNEAWEDIERIFHAALDLPAADRNEYLRGACAGDAWLFAEVETLLDSFEKDSAFLDEAVFERGLETLADKPQKNLSGSTVGFYQIKEKIGSGGMGEVYKAFDTRLDRLVALKFLSESLENDRAAQRRLVKEAQAVAMLEHPNICAVHGIEQIGEQQFIVMQYIEGKTLDENVERPLADLEKFKSLARQLVTAVAFAHSHGVLHRDLKPGNIMLNGGGQIKILDFGLAKVLPQSPFLERGGRDDKSQFSQSGMIIGTVAYMSPEQLRGEKLDYRSDIFSLGIILYELLAGANPFQRSSQAEIIAAILNENSSALKLRAPQIPESLTVLIEKCLHKDREARFQSAAAMLVELERAAEITTSVNAKRRSGRFAAAALVLLLLALLAGSFFYTGSRARRTLAVLPISFDNPLLEKEYLADGLTQSLIEKLSNLSELKVVNQYAVAGFKNEKIEPQTAGRKLNADAALVGSIIKRGDSLVLLTKLVRTSDGVVLTNDEDDIVESKLIELQETLAARVAGKITRSLSDEEKKRLAVKDTENSEAKRLYILGRFHLGRRQGADLKNAERFFREATDLDPAYAKAWAGLADTYALYSLPGQKGTLSPDEAAKSARAAAKTALEIDDSLCEPYNSLGMIKLRYEWDWNGAESYFRAAISRNPEFPQPRLGLSNLLTIRGEFDEALLEAGKVKEFSPFSVSSDLNLAGIYYFKRDYEQMNRVLNASLENFPNHKRLNYLRGLMFLETGKLPEAVGTFEQLYKEDPALAAAPLGYAYGKTGRTDETLKTLAALDELAKKNEGFVSAQEQAMIYLGLGDWNRVFEHLDKACRERFPSIPFVISDPIFDEIKSDARFADLKKCANL